MSKVQLYSMATPNGQKVGIALEEMEIPYDAHTINILKNDQFTPEFIAINPNSKIPAIVDPDGPGGNFAVMESGAILLYLAQKSGKFLSTDPTKRSETIQWLMFQMGGLGPMFGQFGHFFKFAKDKCEHPYPVTRYTNEAKRLLKVLDTRLEGRDYIAAGEYTIADMAIVPWLTTLEKFYQATEYLGLKEFKNVVAYIERVSTREKYIIGSQVCSIH